MKIALKCLALALLAVCLVSGCRDYVVKDINDAAVALRTSRSDDVSRMLARRSAGMVKQRSEDYHVGPEDLLEVSIFEWELREETKTATFRIAESGIISLPVIGDIDVGAKTVGEVKGLIEARLKDGGFIKDPQVSVDIREYRSKRVAVVGAVNDPGVYTLRQNVTTLLEILSLAGGISERAGCTLYVIRSKGPDPEEASEKKIITIDLYELLEQGDLTLNMVLGDGDVLHVPEAAVFSVIGHSPWLAPMRCSRRWPRRATLSAALK